MITILVFESWKYNTYCLHKPSWENIPFFKEINMFLHLNLNFEKRNLSFPWFGNILIRVQFTFLSSYVFSPMILASFYLQQIYMYFRGSGKAAELKHEAARGALRAAMWFTYTSLVAKRLNRIYDGISTKNIAVMLSLFLLSLNYLTVDVWMSQCSSMWGCYLKLLCSRIGCLCLICSFCFVLLCYRTTTFVIVADRIEFMRLLFVHLLSFWLAMTLLKVCCRLAWSKWIARSTRSNFWHLLDLYCALM